MHSFNLNLISPEKKYYEGEVDMVVVPGEDGDFSVLLDHCPIITYIRPGKIEIISKENKIIYFVGRGFVKVLDNNCLVMVDYIKELKDLNYKDAENNLKEVQAKIQNDNIDEKLKQELIEYKKILEEEILISTDK